MFTLDNFGPAFGEPDGSPFCVKAMCLLNMAGLSWTNNPDADVRKAPYQKLPVLHDGNTVIPDSDSIRDYLEAVHGAKFDMQLTPIEKSQARALIRLVEEHLYFCLVYDRWKNNENWPTVKTHFFGKLPAPAKYFIPSLVRRNVLAALSAQGVGRLDYSTMLKRASHDLQAIELAIADGPLLFGDKPSAADASVASVLAAIAASPTASGLCERVRGNSVLMNYIAAVKKVMYPPIRAQ